jgi:hypothetical protein
MSYDLGAFGKQNDVNTLPKLYIKACESDISGIKPSQEMIIFIEKVNKLYPDLDSVPESEIDSCPWASGFDQSDRHWIAPMSYSFINDMIPKILKLAKECNVYLYDPQSEDIIQ